MEELTEKEKKSIIKKVVICIVLLIAMIVIGICLMTSGNVINKLK